MTELDRSVRDFLDDVAAPTPAATGGSVCAVTTSAAAGLVAMTAKLSSSAGDAAEDAAEADRLRSQALELVAEDAASYQAVLAAQRRTDPGRAEALRAALVAAAQPPLRIAHVAAQTTSHAARFAAEGKRMLRGDAITGATLAAAGARSAAALARLNLTAAHAPLDAVLEAEQAAAEAARSAEAALATLTQAA